MAPRRQRAPPLRAQPLEPAEVELVRLDAQPVTGRAADQPRRLAAERASQPRDHRLHRLDRTTGRSLTPQIRDHALARNRLPRAQQQHRQQRPLPRARQRQRPPLRPHLDRSQDPEIHRPQLPASGHARQPLSPHRKSAATAPAHDPRSQPGGTAHDGGHLHDHAHQDISHRARGALCWSRPCAPPAWRNATSVCSPAPHHATSATNRSAGSPDRSHPTAPIGTYGGRVVQRRQGAGQLRRRSRPAATRLHRGHRPRRDRHPQPVTPNTPGSPASAAPGDSCNEPHSNHDAVDRAVRRAAPSTRDPPPRPPRDRRKRSARAARENRARRLSASGAPRAALDLRARVLGGAPPLPLLREAEQHDVAHASTALSRSPRRDGPGCCSGRRPRSPRVRLRRCWQRSSPGAPLAHPLAAESDESERSPGARGANMLGCSFPTDAGARPVRSSRPLGRPTGASTRRR